MPPGQEIYKWGDNTTDAQLLSCLLPTPALIAVNMFFRRALLLTGAGLALASDSLTLSSQCSSALLAVAGSPDAACLDFSILATLALSNSTTSVIPTVDSWLGGLCAQGPCSNATLEAVVTNITTGCSTDLASVGLNTTDPAAVVTAVETYYPTAREVVCLKE